ncbi:LysR family transcriptional regulator [Marinobacterium iners]|uniref:HTH-type transcriptional regulator MetR n=1 Tax=Marinobacterium iners DSM 11526 TaxID=1122198 RepID=A0A1H4GQH4_9GAMM|nr:LysR family transcriptional regulator [Marinobacterium iners]SEB11098.1 LysR family transcriptional regulator, regulator for metE and metH [Marinobacterium iners DSM 11526]
MLDRHHLMILRAVDQQGSLTAAADTLCLTQSALSHSVRKLEQQLGTPVWQKEGRRLRLTQAGRYLLRLAERLLPQFEHAEAVMQQFASGERGTLRIGMECHPCYQWLLKIVNPYLQQWPDVDVDVRQKFQFGGMGALYGHEIDLLVTPDPLHRSGLVFEPVFDYEQVLVVGPEHPLYGQPQVEPKQLLNDTLITYPVEPERLDIFNSFLTSAGCAPRRHKQIETTDIMLQMVAAGRGVAALPRWLVSEYQQRLPLHPLQLGKSGVAKQIFLGLRKEDVETDYLNAFVELARQYNQPPA